MSEFNINVDNYDDDCFDDHLTGKLGKDMTRTEKEIVTQQWRIADLESALSREQKVLDELMKKLEQESKTDSK